MHCPHLKAGKQILKTQDLFFGLNHNLRLRPGELYDMENLSSDLTPVLSTRPRRGLVASGLRIQGMASRDSLCYVEGSSLVINGTAVDLGLSQKEADCPKQLVSMGAWLIILPDKIYINTANLQDFGPMEAEVTTKDPVTLTQCSLDGGEITPDHVGPDTPKAPADRTFWLDTANRQLKQYASLTGIWVVLESPLVKLSAPGIGKAFRDYDGVEISGLPENSMGDLNGAAILYGRGENYVIFPGLIEKPLRGEKPVTVSRRVPRMDFVVESGNRLWGCRYGPDEKGRVVNELYCSKLGDFRNWSCYLGISTDSYRVSLGSDGPFTGAVTLGGHPIFFKENCLHKVFGQFPANFQVQTTACRGVERGSERSPALVGEVVCYKSREGICLYDGSIPTLISRNLGDLLPENAVGGALGSKYYLSGQVAPGAWTLLVYDLEKGLWHREDGLHARFFEACRNELFCADDRGNLLALRGTAGRREEALPWMAESGLVGVTLPGSRYLQKLLLRLLLEPGSRIHVLAEYDSCGIWEPVGTVEGMRLQSFTLPVLPRRCDHFRLRLQGQGSAKLFSVTRVLSPGGETA